jgi:hypothetical protein
MIDGTAFNTFADLLSDFLTNHYIEYSYLADFFINYPMGTDIAFLV